MTVIHYKCGHTREIGGVRGNPPKMRSKKICKMCRRIEQGMDPTVAALPSRARREILHAQYLRETGQREATAIYSCGHTQTVIVSARHVGNVRRPRPCSTCRIMRAQYGWGLDDEEESQPRLRGAEETGT